MLARLLLLVACILPAAVLRPVHAQGMVMPWNLKFRLASANQLRQIALAINVIAAENKDHIPQTLGEVAGSGQLSAKVFIHPKNDKTPPDGANAKDLAAWVNANTDYILVGGGTKLGADQKVLVYEKAEVAIGGKINVAYTDGSVKQMSPDELAEELKKK